MSRNELCYCGSGRKRKKCHKEVHNNSYIEILSNLYQAIENEKHTIAGIKSIHVKMVASIVAMMHLLSLCLNLNIFYMT